MRTPNGKSIANEKVPVLMMHEVFHMLYLFSGRIWADSMLGPDGEDGVHAFWRHEACTAWVQTHPAWEDQSR
eukprot:3199367-Alexandrium_andersonii.AAC.1